MRRLRNSTAIADATVREIETFVRPPGVRGFDLELRNGHGYDLAGRAYHAGSAYHSTARPFVVCRIGEAMRFPQMPQPPVRSNYLPRPYLASQTEALVYLLAHELRHLWQARVTSGRRVWGSRGQFSERDADAYAIKMLRQWRNRD